MNKVPENQNPARQYLTSRQGINFFYAAIVVCTTLFCSCKKENPEPEPEKIATPNPVPGPVNFWLIDSTDTAIKRTVYAPPRRLTAANASIQHMNLDLNSDGSDDIKFSIDMGAINGGMQLVAASMSVTTLNYQTFVLTDSIYSIIHYSADTLVSNTPVNLAYPRILKYKDGIKMNDSWRQGKFLISDFKEQTYYPGYKKRWITGNWMQGPNLFYGLKNNNKIYWIKLSSSYYTSLFVYEMGMVK